MGVPYYESIARHITTVGLRWATAERDRNIETLKAMLAPGFVFVSAAGRIMDRDQYLYRHLDSELSLRFVDWEDVKVSLHPGACVAVGTLRLVSVHGEAGCSREYRASQVYVQADGREWLLAGLFLAPLA